MSNEEFLNKIKELQNNHTIESNEEVIKVIEEEGSKTKIKEEDLKLLEINANVEILNIKINALKETEYKEKINLRGKLISLYREAIQYCKEDSIKNQYKNAELEELKKQKEIIKSSLNSKDKKISIPKKLALKIKDISNTIQIFMTKKDVIKKFNKIIKETVNGTTTSVAITAATCAIIYKAVAIPILISSIPELLPLIGYLGLSSIIRNVFSKTSFENYLYEHSDKYKEDIEKFTEKNKELIEEIAKMSQEKLSCKTIEEKIEKNKEIIAKLDKLVNSTNIKAIKTPYELQALSNLRENKELCEQIKDEYLDGKNNDKLLYIKNNARLAKINIGINLRENSFKDSLGFSGKNISKNMAVILIARLLMSKIAPNSFPIESWKSFIVPFAFAIASGLQNIPRYTDKLKYKDTEYEGKIKLENENRIKAILNMDNSQLKMA